MIKELKLIPQSQPDIALLIKAYDVDEKNKSNLLYRYVQKLSGFGVEKPGFRFTFLGLEQNPDPKKKISKANATSCINKILEHCDTLGINTLVCTDSLYFQVLTGRSKLEESIDGVYPCVISTYEHITVLPSIHYNSIIMAPQKESLLEKSLKVLAQYLTDSYSKPGSDVLKTYVKCRIPLQLKQYLESIMYLPEITCDIETTGLKFYSSNILTIGFGLDKHTAMACPVHSMYHNQQTEDEMKAILKWFFKTYTGKLWFHNALFDVKHLTYRLFMKNLDDFTGMQEGLDAFANTHDTFQVAYLAKNSTYRQSLGLKELSKEFMGEYAENVTDATLVPLKDLLVYNAKDCCATWYVLDTYRPLMIQDEQLGVYNTIMQPSMKPLLKMMLTGLPLDLDRTREAKEQLQAKLDEAVATLHKSHYVKRAVSVLKYQASIKYNESHKTKQKTPDEIGLEFNPNSSDQLRLLLFEILGFEEIEKTKAGKSSTKRGFIEEYLQEAKADGDTEVIQCLEALVDVSQISIILNTFINAFEELSVQHPSGYQFLKGNLKLGGTQCVTDDVLFNTDRGIIPYNMLELGDYVISHDGSQNKVTDLFYNGKKPIYKITTEQGLVLTTSDNHPYFVNSEWIEAKDLKVGDNLSTTSVKEVWKVIKDYPRYSISSWGRVKNSETNNILKLYKKTSGGSKTNRLKVTLSLPNGTRANGTRKDFHVHSLVAKAFIGPKVKGLEVRHLNGISWDNRVENLAYGTSKCNTADAKLHGTMSKRTLPTTKLNQVQVDWLRSFESVHLNNVEASIILNVSRELVRDVRNNKRWDAQNEFSGYTVDFLSDKVLSIEILPQKETYGVTIENTHSHVTNGIVTHNTGRLSSSEPNLQNLPSGSKYGKIIKNCFVAPDGWLFAGADFSALEDRIGAILSKDKNKTLEFSKGFDGHSLRALAFFPEELPDGLQIDSKEDNTLIKKEYGDIRGKSKGPSFAMQYGCGPGKIQQLLKCTKGKADQVYSAFHNLYSGLAEFGQKNKIQGMTNGYVTGAFGLRLRTPKLKAHRAGTKESTEVGSEARSASNMVTQSWGMLMNRALIDFNTRLEKSEFKNKIRLINTIHDAGYLLVKAEPEVIQWANDNLVDCMKWQEGVIASTEVKMEAEVDFGLDWAHQETLHNRATIEEIKEFLKTKIYNT